MFSPQKGNGGFGFSQKEMEVLVSEVKCKHSTLFGTRFDLPKE